MTIEWHIEKRKLSDLRDYHKNPRKITKDQYEQLKRNIERFGLIDKPFINIDNTIIGGHQRVRFLRKNGHIEVDVYVPSRCLSDKEVEELNYRHNENHASWDWDILANQYDPIDLADWGTMSFDDGEEAPKKAVRPKATFEFDNAEQMAQWARQIEDAALEWGAKLKVKA